MLVRRRLLVVIDEMEVGGSQQQILHLLGGLDRERWQPEVMYFRARSFLVDRLERAGIRVHHVPKRNRIDARFFFALRRRLIEGRYDVIHAFSLTAEIWSLLTLATLHRPPPLVASVRGLYLRQSRRFWWLKRQVLRHCDGVISNSGAGADLAAQRSGVERARFDVIGNGVPIPTPQDAATRTGLRRQIGVPDGGTFALFVGRLVPPKNLACLLQAIAALPAEHRPWLALAGDGPLRAELHAQAETLGIRASVQFLGERTDAVPLMQAADFLVLPSHEEGLSNALLEAMAAGCPVIASAVGGNPELVEDAHTGLLFPDDDHTALAAAMARLRGDAGLRQRLSQQARERAGKRHSIAALATATQAVYERCIRAQGAAAATNASAATTPSSPAGGDRP